jgi:opacity protein-like surface antigen
MRTSRFPALAAAAFAVAAALPTVVAAQRTSGDTGTSAAPIPPWERRSSVGLALGGAGLYQSARGTAGRRVQDGGGFDVFGSVAVSAFALGIGFQRSEQRLATGGAGRVTDQGVFVEPRVSVAPFRNFTPYVAGRLAFVRRNVPGSALYTGETRSLTGYGAGAGTLVSVAPGVQLDFSAMYTRLSGGGDVAPTVSPGPFIGGTGNATLLRAGLVIGFDRWGR